MGCFSFCGSSPRSPSRMQNTSSDYHVAVREEYQEVPQPTNEEVLLRIPACKVHLMDEGEAIEVASGEFMLERITEENVTLATIIKVGYDFQWPLTKDEPVVKLDSLHYLFSLPMQDGDPISYGVTFPDQYGNSLDLLDSFLREHSCFSVPPTTKRKTDVDWKEYAPRVEDYNNFLSKAIARGTGQIVKGIFTCSNAYTNQVQKGGETILTGAPRDQNGIPTNENSGYQSSGAAKKSGINKSLKRARNLSNMTQKLSKTMLNGVGIATGSVMGPVLKSQAGKKFFAMVPGEVALASLDAVNRVLDAAEVAQKQTLSATTGAASSMVTRRFGEDAGEATGHALETAGNLAGTAWNVVKIRKAFTPSSAATAGILKNTAKNRS